MAGYTNSDWLTWLGTYIPQVASGALTAAGFQTAMESYTDGWIGIAASDSVLAGKVTDLVSNVVARDSNFDNWINGTAYGGPNGDGSYPLTSLSGGTVLLPCPARMMTLVTHGADAKTGLAFEVLGPWNPGELVGMKSVSGGLIIDTAAITGGCLIAPTGSPIVTFKKNGSAWGSVTFVAATTNVITQSFSSNILNRGDLIAMYAPASGDATFLNFAVTFPGVSS
jgi:hypothetical protein